MPPRIGRIPGKGLTPEAAEALAAMSDPIDTDSDAESLDDFPYDQFDVEPGAPLFPEDETGDGIEDSGFRQRTEPPPPPREAKPGIPTIDEWLDFFSRIVLRVACDWYINWAFRGIDEELLSPRELDRLQMTDEERRRISVPFAEISHKSKFMRKHGRMIVASGGLFDALVAIGTWTSRVNRIARRHKPTRSVPGRVVNDERSGQNAPPQNGPGFTAGANGGSVGGQWRVVNPGG
jgi:hypothetical protein